MNLFASTRDIYSWLDSLKVDKFAKDSLLFQRLSEKLSNLKSFRLIDDIFNPKDRLFAQSKEMYLKNHHQGRQNNIPTRPTNTFLSKRPDTKMFCLDMLTTPQFDRSSIVNQKLQNLDSLEPSTKIKDIFPFIHISTLQNFPHHIHNNSFLVSNIFEIYVYLSFTFYYLKYQEEHYPKYKFEKHYSGFFILYKFILKCFVENYQQKEIKKMCHSIFGINLGFFKEILRKSYLSFEIQFLVNKVHMHDKDRITFFLLNTLDMHQTADKTPKKSLKLKKFIMQNKKKSEENNYLLKKIKKFVSKQSLKKEVFYLTDQTKRSILLLMTYFFENPRTEQISLSNEILLKIDCVLECFCNFYKNIDICFIQKVHTKIHIYLHILHIFTQRLKLFKIELIDKLILKFKQFEKQYSSIIYQNGICFLII